MDVLIEFKNLFLDVWQNGLYGVNISNVIIAIIIFFAFLILRGVFSKLVLDRLKKYVQRTTNQFDNSLVKALEGPANFFPIVLGFFVASSYINFTDVNFVLVDELNRSLVTILIFWVLHQILEPLSIMIKIAGDLLTKDLVNWIIKLLKAFIGVAVALGAQDLFKNLISGILVLVEKRFKVGDWILVDGVIEGTVEKIGFRSTAVRKFDKSLAIIPNFQFAEKAVVNNNLITHRRIDWIIGLEYRTTSEQLKKIKLEIENYIKKNQSFIVNEEMFLSVKVDKFAASSIDIKLICYTKTNDYIEWCKVKDELAFEIKAIVENNKAAFAFPSQSIYVEKK